MQDHFALGLSNSITSPITKESKDMRPFALTHAHAPALALALALALVLLLALGLGLSRRKEENGLSPNRISENQ